ncbi:hypothetical protein CNY89_24250, partial [Amaricoccus sp. HAR-UPW-R2A-40]
ATVLREGDAAAREGVWPEARQDEPVAGAEVEILDDLRLAGAKGVGVDREDLGVWSTIDRVEALSEKALEVLRTRTPFL